MEQEKQRGNQEIGMEGVKLSVCAVVEMLSLEQKGRLVKLRDKKQTTFTWKTENGKESLKRPRLALGAKETSAAGD